MAEDKMIENIERTAQAGKGHIAKRPEISSSPDQKAEQLFGLYNEFVTYRRGVYKDTLRSTVSEEKQATPDQYPTGSGVSAEARLKAREQLEADPLIQRLEGEISRLWDNPQVKALFLDRLRESMAERKPHEASLDSFKEARAKEAKLEEEYYDLMRNHFLERKMTPTLRGLEVERNRLEMEEAEEEIAGMEKPSHTGEKGLLSQEKADLAALLASERFKEYHRQFTEDGFIRTPSRKRLLHRVLRQTASGVWGLLTGETGSGKTKLASVVSRILNGKPPLYASGEERGDVGRLIGTKAMTATGESYYEFGPVTAGETGYTNSLEMEESHGKEPVGEITVIDEINKFNQDSLFGALKVAHTILPGETFNYKELPGVILRKARKGFGLIATRNPATVRYERQDLDTALERLFYNGKITIDYPPMSDQDPELYEMFLGVLMDDNGRVRIAKLELAPSFVDVRDDAAKIVTQGINPDITQHGALYRFALAVSEIHKSFNQESSVARVGTDEGNLDRTVLEMGVLMDWMKSYGAEIEGNLSLTSYLETKLHDFYINIDNQNDQAIFNRIFGHFGFSIDQEPPVREKPHYEVLTPMEMGYLTPRTERAVREFGDEAAPKTKLEVLPDGTTIYYNDAPITIKEGETLPARTTIEYEGQKIFYLGLDPQTGEGIFLPVKE